MKFSLFLPALFLLAASCSMQPTPASLSGSWTQPVPGQPGHVQGMQLLPDGRAVSINMHTLLYQGWQLDGSTSLEFDPKQYPTVTRKCALVQMRYAGPAQE